MPADDRLDLKLNAGAAALLEELAGKGERVGVRVIQSADGARLVDAGVVARGSLAAGIYLARACLGGAGAVELTSWQEESLWLPGLRVTVDQPAAACLGAQYAGWRIAAGDYFAMGSGPARLLALKEELLTRIPYREKSGVGVLVLETAQWPPPGVVKDIALACGLAERNLWLIAARTASMAGSVQIAARVVETALHKLMELGFDVTRVLAGSGDCPLAPVAADDLVAVGRTNDCVLYGGRVYLVVDAGDDEIEAVIERVPASSAADYGSPFLDIFERCNRDFYRIDPLLFSPAVIMINNVRTGRVYRSGRTNVTVLRRSLLGGGNG